MLSMLLHDAFEKLFPDAKDDVKEAVRAELYREPVTPPVPDAAPTPPTNGKPVFGKPTT